jgi:hypothetical protein
MIHGSKIPEVMAQLDDKGKPKRFNITFRKISTGELVELNDVVMTSYFHRQGTLVLSLPNNQFRKIRLVSIVTFNGKEMYL